MTTPPHAAPLLARYRRADRAHYGILADARLQRLSCAPWAGGEPTGEFDDPATVEWLPPCEPTKIVCVGLNYFEHVKESLTVAPGHRELPPEPLLFLKPPSAALGHRGTIRYPEGVTRMDPEGEMALVIGTRASHVDEARALECVAGVTCFNDVSARNYQQTDGQWARAKGFDTFAPFGPVIALGLSPLDLSLELRVNGEVRQRTRTSEMHFGPAFIVHHVSKIMTLEPGDVIATGTPAGIAPIVPGDEVQVEIPGVGVLVNPVGERFVSGAAGAMGERPLLVTGGRLWPSARWAGADAVFIRGGRISAIGRSRDLAAAVPNAPRLEARGGTVTPGLCDAHVHFVPWARGRRQCDLVGCATRHEALGRVSATLAADRGASPVTGRGWDEMGWEARPDRASLDAVSGERPVLLHSHDFHSLWANSAALRAAGVTRATPDPPAGRFERDAAGEPTGVVRENAVAHFAALEEQAGPAIDETMLDDAAASLHAAGITAVHDFQRNAADLARMRALAGRRRLRVLQHVGEEQLAQLAAAGLGSGVGDAWFRIGALKLFADGALGSRTAALLEPYDDGHGLGMVTIPPAELAGIVQRAAAAGFASAIHAIGDRAVRHALDAFAAAREAAPPTPLPPRIEHVQLLHADDLPRFAAIGVVASMQPQHATSDAFAATAAWGARCAMSYPWRSLEAAGVPLAFGSDAPVEPPLPWLGMHAAITRTRPDGAPAGGFVPGQRIGLDSALRAYTEGAASLSGLSGQLGTLEPGAEADLVIWDRDLGAASPEGVLAARPAATVLGGEIVYVSTETGTAAIAGGSPGGTRGGW